MADSVGLMRVVTPAELAEQEAKAVSDKALEPEIVRTSLANHIRTAFMDARNHHESEGIRKRLLHDLRTYRGQYDDEKLREIAKFDGSKVYARMTSVKCRGASALLRDIYLFSERPWALEPTPEPTIPDEIGSAISGLVSTEVGTLDAGGQQVDPQSIEDRIAGLVDAARKAEKKNAKKEADKASEVLDDILREGNFYKALNEMLIDLPIFLFACMKGPIVRKVTQLKWRPDGSKAMVTEPKLFWERVSPFDLYFSPGASEVARSTVMERLRFTRDELYDMRDLAGYDADAIDRTLEHMSASTGGMAEWLSYFENERAGLENREDPTIDQEHLYIDGLLYNGYVRGQWLLDFGVKPSEIDDPN